LIKLFITFRESKPERFFVFVICLYDLNNQYIYNLEVMRENVINLRHFFIKNMKIIIVFILLMMLFGCNSLKTYEEVNNFYKEKYSLDIEEVKNKIRKKVFRDYFKNVKDIDSSLIIIETYYYMGGNFDNLHNHTSFYIDNRRDRV